MVLDPPRTVAVVGNAPRQPHPVDRIDAADWVVRFNNAPGFGAWAGRRCTHLALVNHGGQMREWLSDAGFLARPAVRAAREFLLPFPTKREPVDAQDMDGRDWTHEARDMLAPFGRAVVAIPGTVLAEARQLLATPDRPNPDPSTGFLVTLHLLRKLSQTARVDVFGFGFAGWPGHSWDGERRWFERMEREGRLRLHPVAPPA